MAGFNPYSAGAKRYNGSGTSANMGQTLDPSGYVERSLTQQAAQRMMQNANGNNSGINTPRPVASQNRSGLAQSAMDRLRSPAGGSYSSQGQNPGMSSANASSSMQSVPVAPAPREPNPTWQLPVQQAARSLLQPAQISPLWVDGVNRVQIPARPPLEQQQPYFPIAEAPYNPNPGGLEQQQPQFQPQRMTLDMSQNASRGGGTGINQVNPSVNAGPNLAAAAPSIALPNVPNFAGASAALDADLRQQREAGFSNLNNQIVEIQNALQQLQSGYLQDVQQYGDEVGQAFKANANDFGARGMLSSTGYGQQYTDLTKKSTQGRNKLDQALSTGQQDVLGNRSEAVTAFQNLLSQLATAQAQRDAERAAKKALENKTKPPAKKAVSKKPIKKYATSKK